MSIRPKIFNPDISFEAKAGEVFRYQLEHNPVYGRFARVFGFTETDEPSLHGIPLLPVRAFKEGALLSGKKKASLLFRSSGTSGMTQSMHHVPDPGLYEESVWRGFDHFYGNNPVIGAYTPGYSDNPHSSLVYMLQCLIGRDRQGLSRFLKIGSPLDEKWLSEVRKSGKDLVLFGAAFGLADLAEMNLAELPGSSIVIETGGMKTHKREESDRGELHKRLAEGFRLPLRNVHSEYGMCECLSQAYAVVNGWFRSVPWMSVTIRDPSDPHRICSPGEEGVIGIIDLANLYSCSFILTEDRGVAGSNGFQVLGRWNPDNLRGCNFLIDRD